MRAFDAENMTEETVNAITPIISQPFFNFEVMKGKSLAAAFLANWVVNIVTYNTIYRKVKPLMDKFAEATESKNKADSNLAQVLERVREINGEMFGVRYLGFWVWGYTYIYVYIYIHIYIRYAYL